MTFIGKLFVLVNLALSLVMAVTAFTTYSAGLDWSNFKGDKDRPPGKLTAVVAEIAELGKQLALADETLRGTQVDLQTREDQRRVDRDLYVRELRDLISGKGPVKAVAPDAPNAPPGTPPRLVPAEETAGVPLQPLPYYIARLQELRDENGRIRMDLAARVKEDTELTNQLAGDADGKTKGLRRVLAEERDKTLGLISEEGIVEGLRVNTIVESQLILKRLDSINQSIDLLRAYLKKRHGVDLPGK
ncbi:MAG: hypothetical protein U0840_23510 [Gemmataceae bacterium]